MSLKTRPKNQRCKNKYINSKSYNRDDAEKMFQKFIEKGYSVDEAVEFVEAITGIRINFPINVLVKES
jgi:SOS response regulatory protein OraA/RecX